MKKAKRVFVLVGIIAISILAVAGLISTSAETAAANELRQIVSAEQVGSATCSIEVEYLSPTPDEERPIRATVTYSTTSPEGWHILNWGDGSKHGWQGLSGEEIVTHNYLSDGPFTATLTTDSVDGDEPSCTDEKVVQFNVPTGMLTVEQTEGLEVSASGTYTNSAGSWSTCLDWDDPVDPNNVCFDGTDGEFVGVGHTYPEEGVYTPTLWITGTASTTQIPFVIDLTGDEPPPTDDFTILLPFVANAPAVPECTIYMSVFADRHKAQVTLIWSNFLSEWHLFEWGDGSAVGFFGSSGTETWTHVYNDGEYTQLAVSSQGEEVCRNGPFEVPFPEKRGP